MATPLRRIPEPARIVAPARSRAWLATLSIAALVAFTAASSAATPLLVGIAKEGVFIYAPSNGQLCVDPNHVDLLHPAHVTAEVHIGYERVRSSLTVTTTCGPPCPLEALPHCAGALLPIWGSEWAPGECVRASKTTTCHRVLAYPQLQFVEFHNLTIDADGALRYEHYWDHGGGGDVGHAYFRTDRLIRI